jgi:FkbM family methyltransferase
VPFNTDLAFLQRRILLSDIALVIDVGANVGQYAERLRDIGFAGRIVSFEPGSAAFVELSRRARKDPSHWEARRKAVGDRPGTSVLRISGNSVSSSLLEPGEEHLRVDPRIATVAHERVPVTTLDDEFARETLTRLWLKLDVQGHELAALRGATGILTACYAVQTELSLGELYRGQSKWLDVCGFLHDRGFVLRYLEPGYQDPATGYLQQADALFLRAD